MWRGRICEREATGKATLGAKCGALWPCTRLPIAQMVNMPYDLLVVILQNTETRFVKTEARTYNDTMM